MSSGGSLGAMQRLVEQLKLEAALERIKPKFTHADLSGTSLGSRVGVGSVCNCFGKRLCPATRRMQHRP